MAVIPPRIRPDLGQPSLAVAGVAEKVPLAIAGRTRDELVINLVHREFTMNLFRLRVSKYVPVATVPVPRRRLQPVIPAPEETRDVFGITLDSHIPQGRFWRVSGGDTRIAHHFDHDRVQHSIAALISQARLTNQPDSLSHAAILSIDQPGTRALSMSSSI